MSVLSPETDILAFWTFTVSHQPPVGQYFSTFPSVESWCLLTMILPGLLVFSQGELRYMFSSSAGSRKLIKTCKFVEEVLAHPLHAIKAKPLICTYNILGWYTWDSTRLIWDSYGSFNIIMVDLLLFASTVLLQSSKPTNHNLLFCHLRLVHRLGPYLPPGIPPTVFFGVLFHYYSQSVLNVLQCFYL